MSAAEDLDPALQWAIATGLLSLEQARDVDAFADGLVERVERGELTEEAALELAAAQAKDDGTAVLRAKAKRNDLVPPTDPNNPPS